MLHQIYYAERDYQKTHGRWSKTLEELGLSGLTHDTLAGAPALETTTSLFEASVLVKLPSGKTQRWHIRQDSRIWAD